MLEIVHTSLHRCSDMHDGHTFYTEVQMEDANGRYEIAQEVSKKLDVVINCFIAGSTNTHTRVRYAHPISLSLYGSCATWQKITMVLRKFSILEFRFIVFHQ